MRLIFIFSMTLTTMFVDLLRSQTCAAENTRCLSVAASPSPLKLRKTVMEMHLVAACLHLTLRSVWFRFSLLHSASRGHRQAWQKVKQKSVCIWCVQVLDWVSEVILSGVFHSAAVEQPKVGFCRVIWKGGGKDWFIHMGRNWKHRKKKKQKVNLISQQVILEWMIVVNETISVMRRRVDEWSPRRAPFYLKSLLEE